MPPTVLCVDDERDVAELIRFHLRDPRLQVLTAGSGAEALSLIEQDPPDLLLLDLMLPDIDGLGICEILRQNPPTATLPVLIVSAWSTPETRDLARDLGVIDFVTKPFSPSALARQVRTLLDLPTLPSQLAPHGKEPAVHDGLRPTGGATRPAARGGQRRPG